MNEIQRIEIELIEAIFNDKLDKADTLAERFADLLALGEERDSDPRLAFVPKHAPEDVSPFLPSNYVAVAAGDEGTLVVGYDDHGWTLDGYVIPRLASGLIPSVEVGIGVEVHEAGVRVGVVVVEEEPRYDA